VLLATADRNGGLCLWEAETGHEYLTLAGHTAAVNAVAWRGDSNVLASASEDATLRLWEMENGTQMKNWNGKTPIQALDFTRDGRLVTCGRDQITRIWTQDGKQLLETKPIGEVAVSVGYADESKCMITASQSGIVQVYNDDKAAVLGALVTNPPSLAERLAAAQKTQKEQTNAAAPLIAAKQKAEAEVAAAQAPLAEARKKLAALKADADKIAAEVKQISAARAASDAERAKAAATVQQNESARPSISEAIRHLTEALAKLPSDAKLSTAQQGLNEQLKVLEAASTAQKNKITELTAAITDTDAKLKEANSRLEAANKNVAAAAEQVKPLEAQLQKLSAAVDAAQKAIDAKVADANRAVARWQGEIAFRDQMAILQKDLDAARKVAADRQAELDKANQQLAAVQTTVNTAKAKTDEATKGVDALNAKIQAARTSAH